LQHFWITLAGIIGIDRNMSLMDRQAAKATVDVREKKLRYVDRGDEDQRRKRHVPAQHAPGGNRDPRCL
jgi:hypothetical protein